MWTIANRTPFATERSWTRDKDGNHLWLVTIKASFDLDDAGRLRASDEQPPPLLEPVYRGEPGRSSLLYEADVVAAKPETDVLIEAVAHAPGGRSVACVEVAVRIDDLDKRLLVHGERVYQRDVAGVVPSTPRPFLSQPIVYESAWGGADCSDLDPRQNRIDLRNPVGRGIARRTGQLIDRPAHCIQFLNGRPEARGPAGFGPIASHWSPRLELCGTFDDAWARIRRPLLPGDYDERFVQCAPADQRPAHRLVGGERLGLYGLTPRGALEFALPRLNFELTTHFGSIRRFHDASLGTVIVEPELKKLRVVFHSSLMVGPNEVDHLDFTVVTMRVD